MLPKQPSSSPLAACWCNNNRAGHGRLRLCGLRSLLLAIAGVASFYHVAKEFGGAGGRGEKQQQLREKPVTNSAAGVAHDDDADADDSQHNDGGEQQDHSPSVLAADEFVVKMQQYESELNEENNEDGLIIMNVLGLLGNDLFEIAYANHLGKSLGWYTYGQKRGGGSKILLRKMWGAEMPSRRSRQ